MGLKSSNKKKDKNSKKNKKKLPESITDELEKPTIKHTMDYGDLDRILRRACMEYNEGFPLTVFKPIEVAAIAAFILDGQCFTGRALTVSWLANGKGQMLKRGEVK